MIRIVETRSAEGWYALYATMDADGQIDAWEEPLVCWVVVEDTDGFGEVKGSRVRGIDRLAAAEGGFADEGGCFVEYRSPNEERIVDPATGGVLERAQKALAIRKAEPKDAPVAEQSRPALSGPPIPAIALGPIDVPAFLKT